MRCELRIGTKGGLFLLLCAILLHAPPVRSADFYVRATGSDGNLGVSPETAFATIQRAAENVRGGNAVIVGPGRYAEGDIKPDGNGRRNEIVLFLADPTGGLTGDPPGNVVVDATGFANGFRLSARPWVIVNGFTVTNAKEDGIFVKSISDHSVIANCVVFSNGGRGIRVRDSAGVVVFNNLVYANGGTGIDFGGDLVDGGSPEGAIINNTVYGNGDDGVRIEGVPPSEDMTVIENVITANDQVGLNLKDGSIGGFIGQWNLNTDGYKNLREARGELDVGIIPLLIAPAGADGTLGGFGHADDDFRLFQIAAGQAVESVAVDATPFVPKKLKLSHASTRTDGMPDVGTIDLGFHTGNSSDVIRGFKTPIKRRLRNMRHRAKICEKKMSKARARRSSGRGACVKKGAKKSLTRKCGSVVDEICG